MEESYQLVGKALPDQILENALATREHAEEVDARIAEIISSAKSQFIECGLLCAEVEENSLWALLINPNTDQPYQSIVEWAKVRLGYGRATYMEAKRVVKEFPDIPTDVLSEIPRCNFKHLRLLPESKRQEPEWIEAAKGPEKEFVETIIEELPDLHVEKKTRLIFSYYESSLKVVDQALDEKLKQLKADSPDATKEDALEAICVDWLELA